MPLSEKLNKSLSHQPPRTDTLKDGFSTVQRIEALRSAAKVLGAALEDYMRPSREQSLAVTKLEESLMRAVKGVVLE
jgi:hypothetical protein